MGVAVAVDAVHVEVSTAAPAFELDSTPPTLPSPTEAGGRGLYLVDALAKRWGIEPRWTNRVWFELATSTPHPSAP